MRTIYLDLETTGTDRTRDRIVSIAIAVNNEEPRKRLVNPGIPIPPESTEIHGITDAMVADAVSFAKIARSVLHELEQADVIAGYNIRSFDLPMLSEEFARVGITWPDPERMPKVLDAFKIYQQMAPRKLENAVREFCGRDQTAAHDAAGDVVDVRDVLEAMQIRPNWDEALKAADTPCVDLAGHLTRDEQGFAVFAFGKHKGRRVQDCLDYAGWMLRSDFPANTKACLEIEMDRGRKAA